MNSLYTVEAAEVYLKDQRKKTNKDFAWSADQYSTMELYLFYLFVSFLDLWPYTRIWVSYYKFLIQKLNISNSGNVTNATDGFPSKLLFFIRIIL